MKKIFFVLLLLMVTSCTNKKVEDAFRFNVFVDEIQEKVSFERIVDDYKYIKLETNDSCLLGDIKKVIFDNDRIYVLSGGVYCFDLKGNFLFAINRQGTGPSDYIRIDEMNIENGVIHIYDNARWRITSFSSNTGVFLNSKKLPYSVSQAVVVGGTLLMDGSHIPNKLVKGNERIFVSTILKPEKIERCFFPEKRYEINSENQFYESNGQVYFKDPFYNRVYKIHSDRVENLFCIDCGGLNLSEKDVELLLDEGRITSKEIRDNGKAHSLKTFYENESFIVSEFFIGDKMVTLLYDKSSKRFCVYKSVLCAPYQIPPVEFVGVYNDYFFKVVPANVLYVNNHASAKRIRLASTHPEFGNQKIYNSAQIQDNPIIAMYRFKSM